MRFRMLIWEIQNVKYTIRKEQSSLANTHGQAAGFPAENFMTISKKLVKVKKNPKDIEI